MKKEDLTVLAILAEAVGVLLGILYIGVGEGYLLGVHACCVLQHADHGGVIVPQLVQLQEV